MRVLIVDDEPMNRFLLQQLLKFVAECDVAADGREGVDAFTKAFDSGQPYDLILLDIMMPRMSGQEALKLIRTYEFEKGVSGSDDVVIFMVSDLTTEDHVVEAFFKGCCTDYIAKPIRKSVLFDKMRENHLLA